MGRHAVVEGDVRLQGRRLGVTRLAGDGLLARVSGPWTREKLTYVRKYASAFMTAMAPKRAEGKWDRLVYIDLLAGPGRGIDRKTGREFDGSPLQALGVTPLFDQLIFADLNRRNVEALRQRIPAQAQSRVDLRVGDCNTLAREVVAGLSQRTLGLAFVDPQGLEAGFELFRALASRRIDVLFWFPGIGICRNLSRFAKRPTSPMDRLWDGPAWRDLPSAKLAAGIRLSPQDILPLDRPWVAAFRAKMRDLGFHHQDDGDPDFRNEKNAPMYHLLFLSQHAAGLTIWRKIKKIEPSGQRTLPLV